MISLNKGFHLIVMYHPPFFLSIIPAPGTNGLKPSEPSAPRTDEPPALAVVSSVYPAALSSLGLLCGTNTYEQNCQSSESKLSLLGVCRVVKVVDEVNSHTPFKNLPSILKLTPLQRRYPAVQDQTPHYSTSPSLNPPFQKD